jgi:hypothetical protein
LENVEFTKHLDWVTATWSLIDDPFSLLPLEPGFERVLAVPGGKHYKVAWRLQCGGVFAYSTDERMGVMVMLPGLALQNLREGGWSDQDTVDWLRDARNITRLDYCMNVIGGAAKQHSSHDAYNAWKDKRIKTRMRLDVSFKDEKVEFGGQSYYFGSKMSDQRVICYDKAVEQGISEFQWTRVEGRFKDNYAKALLHDMVKFGVIKAGDTKLRNIWDAEIDWFQEGLLEERVELRKMPRTEPQIQRWLWATVLAAIRKNVSQHRDIIEAFYEEVGSVLYGPESGPLWQDLTKDV